MAGIQLSAKIEGLDELKAKLANSPTQLDNIEQQMLKMAAMITQAAAKEKAPVDTSFLRKSIQYELKGTKGNRYATVGTNVKYAIYQEFGTGIYGPKRTPIVPKRARVLAFRTKDGHLVFTKQVKGSAPKKFMLTGIERLKDDMYKVIDLGKKLAENLLK